MLPCFRPMKCPNFGTGFRLEKEGIWTSVLHGNCNSNFEIDVRLLNHLNWTSITKVMVHFPNCHKLPCFDPTYCPDFGTDFWSRKMGKLD